MKKTAKTRVETDSMGRMEVPATAFYGASTQRAVINFPISNLRLPRSFIRASSPRSSSGAAEANQQLGLLDTGKASAIKRAAPERLPAASTTSTSSSTCFRPDPAHRPT